MTTSAEEMELRDEDRLPWLEPAADVDDDDGISPGRLAGLVLAALLMLGVVIGGIYWWQGRQSVEGDGELIAAQEGDYKVKPDAPGGMAVEGRGDTQFATSEGASPDGTIDLDALPEAPVAKAQPKAPPAPPPAQAKAPPVQTAQAKAVARVPESGGRLQPRAPVAQPGRAPAAAPAGAMIQLGAFSSETAANQAWDRLAKRFAFLQPLGKQVVSVKSSGATLYRLRAAAPDGGKARDLCGRLKVGGEACVVVG